MSENNPTTNTSVEEWLKTDPFNGNGELSYNPNNNSLTLTINGNLKEISLRFFTDKGERILGDSSSSSGAMYNLNLNDVPPSINNLTVKIGDNVFFYSLRDKGRDQDDPLEGFLTYDPDHPSVESER